MSQDLETLAEQVATRGDKAVRRGAAESEIGSARRLSVADMEAEDWRPDPRMVWGVQATGHPPSADAGGHRYPPEHVPGPPSYYPKAVATQHLLECTWTPPADSDGRAWLEVSFPAHAPPAQAIRIFEMRGAGRTVEVEIQGPGEQAEVVWRGPAVQDAPEPEVFEVVLEPPRHVERVRIHVGTAADEGYPVAPHYDAVALLTTGPRMPSEAAKKQIARGRATSWGLRALLLIVLPLLALGVAVAVLSQSANQEEDAEASAQAKMNVAAGKAAARRAGSARAERVTTSKEALAEAGVVWASDVVGASSRYPEDEGWEPHQATGAPDLWPTLADDARAWASAEANAGEEWLELAYPEGTVAAGIVILETLNPGAVSRLDADGEVIWRGEPAAASTESPTVLRVTLPEPRPISTLKVVLASDAVEGWNEIDAVGLIPPR